MGGPTVADVNLAECEAGERGKRPYRVAASLDQLQLFQPVDRDGGKLAFGVGFARRFAPVASVAILGFA